MKEVLKLREKTILELRFINGDKPKTQNWNSANDGNITFLCIQNWNKSYRQSGSRNNWRIIVIFFTSI